MKEHIKQEDKLIIAGAGEQQKNLEEAKRVEQEKAKLDELAGQQQIEMENWVEGNEQIDPFFLEYLEEGRESVNENMPEDLPEEIAQQQKVKKGLEVIPEVDAGNEYEYEPDMKVARMNSMRSELEESKKAAKKLSTDDADIRGFSRTGDLELDLSIARDKVYKKKIKTASDRLKENFTQYMNREQENDKHLKESAQAERDQSVGKQVDQDKIKWDKIPNASKLAAEHKAIKKERIIKHAFKPDEKIMETVVEDKEHKVAQKGACRKRLTREVNEVIDMKIKARADVDIEYKKKMDYRTFNELSEFAPYMDKEQMSDLVQLYGEKTRLEKKEKDDPKAQITEDDRINAKNAAWAAMDMMTDAIMKIDTESFDLSNDEELTRCAKQLEQMSGAIRSYTSFLSKNPDYLADKLTDNAEKEKFGGRTYGGEIMKQVQKLTAISNYYRIRKLVIEDDLYASLANEEISMIEQPGDTLKMKNLRRNLRASYYASFNLDSNFKDKGWVLDPDFKNANDDGMEKRALMGDKIIVSFSLSESESEEAKAILATEEAHKDDEVYLRNKEKEFVLEKHSGFNVVDKVEKQLKILASQEKYINKYEQERFFVPPEEYYHLLTLDPKKLRTTPAAGKDIVKSNSVFDDTGFLDVAAKRAGKGELSDRYFQMGKKKRKKGVWNGTPKFKDGNNAYLADLSVSDDWARSSVAFSTEYAYHRTDDEMLEMLDILSIQEDEKKWDEIKKDPEKLAYYESAYIEMAMKHYQGAYATAVRTAETIGFQMLLMHPIDLAQQMTLKLRTICFGNVNHCNILQSRKSEDDAAERLFKENNKDGRYIFDLHEFYKAGSVNGNAGLKFSCINIPTKCMGDGDFCDAEDFQKALFGTERAFTEVIIPEYKKYKEKMTKAGKGKMFEKWDNRDIVKWFLSEHPEYYSTEMLTKKVDGEFLFKEDVHDAMQQMLSKNEKNISEVVSDKKIRMPSEEEIKAYEKSLKDRNFPKIRYKIDIKEKTKEILDMMERLEEEKKEAKELEKKDPKSGRLRGLKKSIPVSLEHIEQAKAELRLYDKINENIKKDPYALKLIMSGFEEFKYTDSEDKPAIMNSQQGL